MRYAILRVSPFTLIEIFKSGFSGIQLIQNAPPKDAQFVRAFVSDTTGWGYVSLVLESKEFAELSYGQEIPVLPDPIFERVSDGKEFK